MLKWRRNGVCVCVYVHVNVEVLGARLVRQYGWLGCRMKCVCLRVQLAVLRGVWRKRQFCVRLLSYARPAV